MYTHVVPHNAKSLRVNSIYSEFLRNVVQIPEKVLTHEYRERKSFSPIKQAKTYHGHSHDMMMHEA